MQKARPKMTNTFEEMMKGLEGADAILAGKIEGFRVHVRDQGSVKPEWTGDKARRKSSPKPRR